jgi:hypothetical protein
VYWCNLSIGSIRIVSCIGINVFIILKQGIDTVKVETGVSIDNEEDVIGMETDAVCVPQQCELEVSHIWSWFL